MDCWMYKLRQSHLCKCGLSLSQSKGLLQFVLGRQRLQGWPLREREHICKRLYIRALAPVHASFAE